MFGFPHIQRDSSHQLSNNIITSAIFQVKFPMLQDLISKKKEITDDLNELFPNVENIVQQSGALKFSQDGTPILESASSKTNGFEFRSSDNNMALAIVGDAINLTIFGKAYKNFKYVSDIFISKLVPLLEKIGVSALNRIAIRKVNALDINKNADNETDHLQIMNMIYNNAIIRNVAVIKNENELDRAVSYITLKNADNYKLNLGYGLLDINQQTPRQLLLDVDVFKVEANISIENIIDELKKINDEIYDIFAWSLNPKFLKDLQEGAIK